MVERAALLIGAVLLSSCGLANAGTGGGVRPPFADLFRGNAPQGRNSDGGTTDDPPGQDCIGGDVILTTDDDIELNALWAPEGNQAIVLVHKEFGDRTNWGGPTIDYFREQGYSVLALDRRVEDRDEPSAKLDVKVAADFLGVCGIGKWGVVGASTGTTVIFDYAIQTAPARDPDLSAIVFLSPGGYTGRNNAYEDHFQFLAPIRGLSAVAEADTNGGAQLNPTPDGWTSKSYTGDAHGEDLLVGPGGEQLRADLELFLADEVPTN